MSALDFDIETLESRMMMAGDVSASVAGGDLRITGDNASNEVVIRATADGGSFIVEGLNGTTINGAEFVELSGVTDDFRINLRDGNNMLALSVVDQNMSFHEFNVPDDLKIRAGDGDDLIVIENTEITIGDQLNVSTGGGADAVFVRANIDGNLRMNTGSGNDWVEHRGTVDGRAKFSLGSGNDRMISVISVFGDRARIGMGGGDDQFYSHEVLFQDDARLDGNGGTDAWLDCAIGGAQFMGDQTDRFESVESLGSSDLFDGIDSELNNYARAQDRDGLPWNI